MCKVCSKCDTSKDLSEYYFDKKRNRWYSHCKKCNATAAKINKNKKKKEYNDKRKLARVKYKEKEVAYRKKYYDEKIRPKNKNIPRVKKEKISKPIKPKQTIVEKNNWHAEYRKNNREKLRLQAIKYRLDNKEKVLERDRDRSKNASIEKRIIQNLRTRTRVAITYGKGSKSQRTLELLGGKIEDVKLFIASKFTTGMSWDNYGPKGWHIDHIKPCAKFDLTDPEQQKICFHYTNLQPLWATTEIAMSYGEGPDYIGNLEKGHSILEL